MITKPNSVVKNAFLNFGLSKASLISHALVQANSYFKESINWRRVVATYVSSVGNQFSLLSFNIGESDDLTAVGFFAEEARSNFYLSSITIYDKQNGRLRISIDNMATAEDSELLFA